jgi:hypothetical protein
MHILSASHEMQRPDRNMISIYYLVVRHVTGTGSGLLGGIPRAVVQISALL